MKDESYLIRQLSPSVCQITKMVDGRVKHDSVYDVANHECQCWQARRGQCRHMTMRAHWLQHFSPSSVTATFDSQRVIEMELLPDLI